MKIGELVRKSGLTERMLRHYEQIGILTPRKTSKGTRQYDNTDLVIARLIQKLRELDIPLDVVAEIAQERVKHQTGDASAVSVGTLLESLAEHLAKKAQHALNLRTEIVDAVEKVRQCRGCENLPTSETCPQCPMNELATENPIAALIWR